MSEELFNKDNSNLDGSDETSSVTNPSDLTSHVFQFVNSADVDVTFEVFGTRREDDANFDDKVSPGSTTVTSSDDAGSISLNQDPWESLRVDMSFTANPTTGSVEVYNMEDMWS